MSTKLLKTALEAGRTALENTKKAREALSRAVPRLESFMSKHASQGLSVLADEVQVCTTGPNCCKRGSIELMGELSRRIAADKLPLKVVPGPCQGRCSQGPNMQVGTVVYTRMNEDKLGELIESTVTAKQVSVKLLADSEYVGDAIACEEKRCRLVLEHLALEKAQGDLKLSLEKLHANLPDAGEKRTLAEIEILQAIALESEIAKELTAASETLSSVIVLKQFVTITLARRMAERVKPAKS